MKLFILILQVLSISIYSDSLIDLQFLNSKVKLLSNKSTKQKNLNHYLNYEKKTDSRFINLNSKLSGLDIVKKVIQLEKEESIEFQINEELNHKIHLLEYNPNSILPSNEKNLESKLNFFLNNEEVKSNLVSKKKINTIKVKAVNKINIEKLKLIPINESIKKNDVLFIVIDSLRADVLGVNGSKYGVSSNLDKLANESTNYSKNLVNSSWTRPSTFNFFTSLYASKLFINFWDYPVFKNELISFYNSDIQTLPAILSRNGYETIMLGNNPFLTDFKGIGADVGFHSVFDYSNFENDTLKISQHVQKFYLSLNKMNAREPYFIFLNFNDPHKPYTPPLEHLKKVKNSEGIDPKKKEYLGEVAFVDTEIGKIISLLKELNLYDNTMIIITSDHGEVMNPKHAKSVFNGVYTLFGHGQGLYNEDIHTPLLIKYPKQNSPKKINSTTRSIDIFPTILEISKIDYSLEIDGISLLKIEKEQEERIYYGESRGVIGIQKDNYKWMQKVFGFHRKGNHWNGIVSEETDYLFNLKSDPNEETDLKDNTKKKEFLDLAHSFWKKKSIFHIRISNLSSTDREVKFSSNSTIGKSVLCDKNGKPITNHLFQQSNTGFSLKKNFTKGEILEFQFLPYPDISFPKLNILVDDRKLKPSEYGVGERDIYPTKCKNEEECIDLFIARTRSPEIPKNFRVQVWLETKSNKLNTETSILEKEAIEILKKQGYIQ